MILLDEMAVRFTTSGEGQILTALSQIEKGMMQLRVATETSSRVLVDQFGNVARATTAAASQHGAAVQQMATHSEHMGKKMEHFAVTAAFALTAMANGSESAVVKIAHGVAMLGFAFGPVTGAITTFVAIAGEQLIHWFMKAQEQAEKTQAAFEKSIRALGRGEDYTATAKQANRLLFGDPFAEIGDKKGEGAEEFAKQMVAGGVKGLQARRDAILAKVKALGPEPTFDTSDTRAFDAWRSKIATLTDQLGKLDAQLDPLKKAQEELQHLALEQAKVFSTREGPAFQVKQAEDAAKRLVEIANIRRTGMEAAAKAQYETAIILAEKHVDAQLSASRRLTAEELRLSRERAAAIKATGTANVGRDPDWAVKYAAEMAQQATITRDAQARESAIRRKGMEDAKGDLVADHAQRMAEAKDNFGRQLELNAGYFAILQELYPEDRDLFRAAEEEKTHVVQQETAKRLTYEEESARLLDNIAKGNAMALQAREARILAQSQKIAGMVTGAFDSLMSSGGGIGKFSDYVMQQMGAMFIRIGEGWVAASAIFRAAALAIADFSGAGSLAAGLAMIALGSALSSAGSRGGGGGGGGGSYSGGGYSSTNQHSYIGLGPTTAPGTSMTSGATMPAARQSTVVNATIIGANDPTAQREILQLIARAERRGSTSG